MQSIQAHQSPHKIVNDDRGNVSYSQISSYLGSLVVVHVLKPEIVVGEVVMFIVEPEGEQFEVFPCWVDFAEPKGEFIYDFDTVEAPCGSEVESQVFEWKILEFFLLIGFGINDRPMLCQ